MQTNFFLYRVYCFSAKILLNFGPLSPKTHRPTSHPSFRRYSLINCGFADKDQLDKEKNVKAKLIILPMSFLKILYSLLPSFQFFHCLNNNFAFIELF